MLKEKETMKLIHYGAKSYKRDLFKSISDIPFSNKPDGGLWTSVIGSEYGWKEWCEENSFGKLDSSFELEFEGSVMKIDSIADMNRLPWINSNGIDIDFVSFQALCVPTFYYDAIHLTMLGEERTRFPISTMKERERSKFSLTRSLYGWDCETVLIMNPNSINVLKN